MAFSEASHRNGSPIHFRVADIGLARRELDGRGVAFSSAVTAVRSRRPVPVADARTAQP